MGFVGERSQPTQRPSLVATTIDFMVQCHQQRVDRSFLETILFQLLFSHQLMLSHSKIKIDHGGICNCALDLPGMFYVHALRD